MKKLSILEIIDEFKKPCSCGLKHETTIKGVKIGSGITKNVGEILKNNGFSKNLLLVADKNTLKASEGILDALSGFFVTFKIYDNLRVAEMKHVEEIENIIKDKDISVLSVGTGSVNDPCRLACARQNKLLCIFATAPSMDGFASYGAPIVKDGFKSNYSAKSPEVIIADTKILANSPTILKSAGFGDMISKYIALIDWKVSSLVSGELYCEKVAELTRNAIDTLMGMADRVTLNDEETAKEIFESLLLTGIGMSFMKNSRPASGSEHIIAHLIELLFLKEGKVPNYHGEDVGVCSLNTLKLYNEWAKLDKIDVHKENVDFNDIYAFYGDMSEDVRKLNTPNTITDEVDLFKLKENWGQIRKIIKSVPTYEECYLAMKKAGAKTDLKEIGLSEEFYNDCEKYSPFMRRRLTLLRLKTLF